MSRLASELGLIDAHDLGPQLVTDDNGEEFLAYVTAGYFVCTRCEHELLVASKLDCALVRSMGSGDPVAFRFESDRSAIGEMRGAHDRRCCRGIKGNLHDDDASDCPACRDLPR